MKTAAKMLWYVFKNAALRKVATVSLADSYLLHERQVGILFQLSMPQKVYFR